MKKVLPILFVLIAALASGQDTKRFFVSLSFGPGVGLWNYQQGVDPNSAETLGWDKSRAAPVLEMSLNPGYAFNNFEIGADLSVLRFYENLLRTAPFSRAPWRIYEISEKFVPLYKLGLFANYRIVNSSTFSLALSSKAGVFNLETTHPRKEFFSSRYYFTFGIQAGYRLSKGELLLLIDQANHHILTEGGREEERHKLISVTWKLAYLIRL